MNLENNINLENYETFYLDYLEGNLSDGQIVAFESFLTIHPELRMEDLDLPKLVTENEALNNDLKIKLKQGITSEIDYTETLLIGEIENQNSIEESKWIQAQIEKDTLVKSAAKLYEKTILVADQTLIYQHKNELRKRETIALWPWISTAAASVVIAFTIYSFNQNSAPGLANVTSPDLDKNIAEKLIKTDDSDKIANENVALNVKKFKGANKTNVYDNVTLVKNNDEVIQGTNSVKSNRRLLVSPIFNIEQKIDKNILVPELKSAPQENYVYNEEPIEVNEQNLKDLAIIPSVENLVASKTPGYLLRPYETMPNPISGITQIAQQLTNTEIDFRKADPTKRKSGGLHIKIGKFEYSRRKR